MGVKEIFTPGAALQDIVDFVKEIRSKTAQRPRARSLSRAGKIKGRKGRRPGR
jgi:hypothetical protein